MWLMAIQLAILAGVGSVSGQFNNWSPNQISTSICTWKQPRAALLRDTVYLDGGTIYWTAGLDDGAFGETKSPLNTQGWILRYNLSEPFTSDTNKTGLLVKNKFSKARGEAGNNDGGWPNAVDGGMLANDHQFYLYGGVTLGAPKLPAEDAVLGYRAYSYGAEKPSFNQGFDDSSLDEGVSRYVAYGSTVNAPSENKAWYFSGLTSPSKGRIFSDPDPEGTTKATEISNTLITLDMQTQMREEWRNETIDDIGRSGAEVVWVPVGEQGILVVLGGATHPEWAGTRSRSDDPEASEEDSPGFMRFIDIYDVATKEWYRQRSEDAPGTRARGCAVVATASDRSSFNIYYYGGYDALDGREEFSDEVWVLSLPSFTWTLINEGTSLHARAGHKCFKPYGDQMLAFGGYTPQSAPPYRCLDKGPIVNFNLTSGQWLDSYHPNDHGDYGVPSVVVDKIGGDAAGGATATEPAVSGWATDALEDIFAIRYDMNKITTWGPYPAAETDGGRPDSPDDGGDNGSDDNNNGGGGGGLPSWVAPVLGVVLGLMLVTGFIVVFCLWRKRKALRRQSSEPGTENPRLRIVNWLSRNPPPEKAVTITSTEELPPGSPEMGHRGMVASERSYIPSPPPHDRAEADDTALHELGDTSPPVELSDTGLSHNDVIQKHTHFANGDSISNPSHSSFSIAGAASSISRSTGFGYHDGRLDSPPLIATPDLDTRLNVGFLDRETSPPAHELESKAQDEIRPLHQRKFSDLSTQSISDPISPPTAGEVVANDYISAGAALVSPVKTDSRVAGTEAKHS